MVHPLVRATEAFLCQHLGLLPPPDAGKAGKGGKMSKGVETYGRKNKSCAGSAEGDGGTAASLAALSVSAGDRVERDVVEREEVQAPAPYVTLLISLSGGKEERNTENDFYMTLYAIFVYGD